MKRFKKAVSGALAFMLVAGVGSCNSGGRTENTAETTTTAAVTTTISNELDHQIDYEAEAEIEEIDEKNEEGTGKLYVPGQKAGLVKALCYYDLNNETPALSDMLAERFGGYIETVTLTPHFAMIVNEEGRLLGLPDNFTWHGQYIKGTAVFVGIKDDEFVDIDSGLEADLLGFWKEDAE